MTAEARRRAEGVRLLCLDVDGVLTDGGLQYTEDGGEAKVFCTQDGQALKMLAGEGIATAIITGRSSRLLERRMRELDIDHVYQGAHDKRVALTDLLERTGLSADAVAHVGDDIPDLPLFRRVGLAVAPANRHPALDPHVHHVTEMCGGHGAVREVCHLILCARGRWADALAPYL